MTDIELAEEIEQWGLSAFDDSPQKARAAAETQIIAALRRGREPYKAVKGGGRLTYDKATRTIRDSDGVVRLELSEGDADMFCERPPSGEMVMVPREPTDAMRAAGYQQYVSADKRGYSAWQDHLAVYRAMLSAAEAEVRKP